MKSRIGRPSPNSSQLSHYHSVDRDLKSKQNSKSKSYLIEYLNNRNHTTKAESTGKLEQIRRDERARSETERKPLANIRYSSRTRQGVLITNPSKPNQDSVLIYSADSEGLHLFAVADGHGIQGHSVSQLTVKRLEEYFRQNWGRQKNQEGLFTEIYSRIQGELFETKDFNANTSGTTLVSLLLEGNRQLTCANVGDSRAILARQSTSAATKSTSATGKSSTSPRTTSHPFSARKRGSSSGVGRCTVTATNRVTPSALRECGSRTRVPLQLSRSAGTGHEPLARGQCLQAHRSYPRARGGETGG